MLINMTIMQWILDKKYELNTDNPPYLAVRKTASKQTFLPSNAIAQILSTPLIETVCHKWETDC